MANFQVYNQDLRLLRVTTFDLDMFPWASKRKQNIIH